MLIDKWKTETHTEHDTKEAIVHNTSGFFIGKSVVYEGRRRNREGQVGSTDYKGSHALGGGEGP